VVYQELLKIPPDIILMVGLVVQFVRGLEFRSYRGTPTLEELVDRILVRSVHIGLCEHLEIGDKVVPGSHVLQHGEYLGGIGSGFLSKELVTGKAQNFKWAARVLLCKCIESIVLRGVASEGGQVDHQQHLVTVLWPGEGDVGCLLNVFCSEIIQAPGV